MNITTYQSSTAWPNKRWLAHMELAPNCYMDFFGASEQEAKGKAEGFYKAETERQRVLVGSSLATLQATPEKLTSVKPADQHYGRGKHFAGKVWMLNHSTKQKVRVDPSEIATYVANGYVRGGARSQFS